MEGQRGHEGDFERKGMENIRVLCDTDVIIEYLKGNEDTKRFFAKIDDKGIALSAITMMELF